MTGRLAHFALLWMLISAVCFALGQAPSAPVPNPASPSVYFVATLRNGFSMRFDHREQRGESSRLFLDTQGNSFVDIPTANIVTLNQEAAPAVAPELKKLDVVDIPSAIEAASDRHGIDPDLLYSVIRAESDFNPHAVSRKGAQGLMQLMPQTAGKLGVSNAFDTASNVEGGTRYLRELLDRYHYDLAKALAAYNAGPARVDQYHGVPPFHETRVYVARIIREYNKAVLSRRKLASDRIASVAGRVKSSPSPAR